MQDTLSKTTKTMIYGTGKEINKTAIKDAGLHFQYHEVAHKDVSCIGKWATKKFLCWYCKVQPIPHSAKTMEFELEKGAKMSHAVDVCYRCPKCGLQFVFGLPVTKEEYESVKSVASEILYS